MRASFLEIYNEEVTAEPISALQTTSCVPWVLQIVEAGFYVRWVPRGRLSPGKQVVPSCLAAAQLMLPLAKSPPQSYPPHE